MLNTTPADLQRAALDLQKDGYVVLRQFLAGSPFFVGLLKELETYGRGFHDAFSLDQDAWQHDVAPDRLATMYRGLRYLPSLVRLAAADEILAAVRALGLQAPAVMHSFNVRMDASNADAQLFHWHQDFTYLLGSKNSVTLWLPLGRADVQHGTIEVIPESHRSGVSPFKAATPDAEHRHNMLRPKDIVLANEPVGPGTAISADAGDVVVFSQFLLHRSMPNRSEKVRWTAQLRYSDLREPDFIEAGFPFGDSTTVYKTSYWQSNE